MNRLTESKRTRQTHFRPPLEGCVAKDLNLSRRLLPSFCAAHAEIAHLTVASLDVRTDPVLRAHLPVLAEAELEQYRTLGELITALGGGGALATARGRGSAASVSHFAARKRREIDLYETLMSCTGDRVVRSVLASLLSRERRMLSVFEEAIAEESCDG